MPAVIFDLDGTLLATLDDLADSANRALSAMGFPRWPTETYNYHVGDGVGELVRRILPEDVRDDAKVAEEFRKCFMSDYQCNWNNKTKCYEGIEAMLDGLAATGIPCAILSNKPDMLAKKCFADYFGKWEFVEVLGNRPEFPRKPDPGAAMWLAGRLDTFPADVFYVGDTATDMETAVAAGFVPVGVTWGFRPRSELEESGAKFIIDSPEELLEIITE